MNNETHHKTGDVCGPWQHAVVVPSPPGKAWPFVWVQRSAGFARVECYWWGGKYFKDRAEITRRFAVYTKVMTRYCANALESHYEIRLRKRGERV